MSEKMLSDINKNEELQVVLKVIIDGLRTEFSRFPNGMFDKQLGSHVYLYDNSRVKEKYGDSFQVPESQLIFISSDILDKRDKLQGNKDVIDIITAVWTKDLKKVKNKVKIEEVNKDDFVGFLRDNNLSNVADKLYGKMPNKVPKMK